jgi:flavin-dependent dehydrogenase
VRLYEKSYFPRPKLCGGFLSFEGLEDLDDLNILDALKRDGVIPLHRTVIASTRGTLIESSLPTQAFSVSRESLDLLLLEEARRAGVEVYEGTDGTRVSERSDITVIATGRLEQLRRKAELTPWYASPSTPFVGIQAAFEQVAGMTDQVELDLVDSGYVGLARQTQGVNVCALTTPEAVRRWGPDLDHVLRHFINENPILRNHLKAAKRKSDWLAVGPVRLGIRQLAKDRTFYVGDAACVVDPFAGEGMSIGLYSSRLLLHALEQTNEAPAHAYTRLWKEAFLPALRWNAVTRMLYSVTAFREPSLRLLGWFPQGIHWLTELTRTRRLETR